MRGDCLDLIGSLIQYEGNYDMVSTTKNYDRTGGVSFNGYHNETKKHASFVIDRETVEYLASAETIEDVIGIYREIGFFEGR